MSESGAVDNASMAAPGTVKPGLPDMDSLWEEIDLTGKEMKPFYLPPVIKSGFPWLPVIDVVTGVSVVTYFLILSALCASLSGQ